MKKFLTTMLIVIMLLPFSIAAQTIPQSYKPITKSELPAWVPNDSDIRDYMVRIFNSAIEMYNVKAVGYVMTKAWKDGKTVWVHLERATLSADIQIGEFEQIDSVSIVNSLLRVKYKTTEEVPFAWKEFTIGGILGIGVTLLIYGLVKSN